MLNKQKTDLSASILSKIA